MGEKTEKLGVGLSKAEKRQIRIEAARREVSMSELARRIILDELDIGEDNREAEGEGNSQTATACD